MNNYKSIDIIGGGIIGTTLATELLRLIRRHGMETEVHLFERQGQLGIENTEKSFEGVRTFWFTEEEIRFYLTSIRAFENLAEYFGEDGRFEADDPDRVPITASYCPVGYHYFLSEDELKTFQPMEELFKNTGIPVVLYSKEEAQEIDWIRNNFDLDAEILDADDWVFENFNLNTWMGKDFGFDSIIPESQKRTWKMGGYVHVPVAGFVSAGDITASYRAVFEKLGGFLHLNSEVVGVDGQERSVRSIRFRPTKDDGRHIEEKETDYIVNTAGAWSDGLNKKILGERLGVTAHRRIPHIVMPPPGYDTDHGMVILKNRVIRPDDDKIWLYYTPEDEVPGIITGEPDDRMYDEYFFKYVYPVFCHPERPFIRNAEQLGLFSGADKRGWLGHYADTPDERPLIGAPRPEKLSNYAVSIGYSGHGVQASVAAAIGLSYNILGIADSPVRVPEIYSASRDLGREKPDHSRL